MRPSVNRNQQRKLFDVAQLTRNRPRDTEKESLWKILNDVTPHYEKWRVVDEKTKPQNRQTDAGFQ